MTWRKRTIMEMAREAGVTYSQLDGSYKNLERFAELVRADLYKEMHDPMVLACKKMVADERERIAKWYASEGHMMFPVAIPDVIRSGK